MSIYSRTCLYFRWAENHKKLYVTCLLIACFLSNFCFVGSIYTWGNIQPYLVSYIRQRSSPSTLRYTESTYMYSSQYAMVAIGHAIGGQVEVILGVRMTVLIGGILSSGGLFLSYFVVQHSFWLLLITFGFLYPVGSGIVYFAVIVSGTQWVSQKRSGLVIGFVTAGISAGSLCFSLLQTAFINPNNVFPNDAPYESNPEEKYFAQTEVIDQVPYLFVIEGAIFMLLTVASVPIVSNASDRKTDSARKLVPAIFLKKLIIIFRLRSFYLQWLVAFSNITCFGLIASFYKTYGIEVLQLSDYFLTALGAVAGGFFNFAGRLLFGFLADKMDYKIAYVLQSGLMAIFLLTLYITSLGYGSMYFIWICCIFLWYGGFCTLIIVAAYFTGGKENFNFNFALIVTTSQVTASFTYGIISDFCFDYLSWSGILLLTGCLTVSQIFLIMLFPDNEEVNKPKKYTKNLILYLVGVY